MTAAVVSLETAREHVAAATYEDALARQQYERDAPGRARRNAEWAERCNATFTASGLTAEWGPLFAVLAGFPADAIGSDPGAVLAGLVDACHRTTTAASASVDTPEAYDARRLADIANAVSAPITSRGG
jgi:hypothetical protein